MAIVAETITRNRRLYQRRVSELVSKLEDALDAEKSTVESKIIDRANDGYAVACIDQTFHKIHHAILALHRKADEEHVEQVVTQWVEKQQWGPGIEVSVAVHYGLIHIQWRKHIFKTPRK